MKLTFLSASMPLTKSYSKDTDGTIDITPYPLTSKFTSHVENISTIEEFHDVLVTHAELGHCLLKGNLQQNIRESSRAGLMSSEATMWLVLDFDGLDAGGRQIDDILNAVGLGDYDYILQWSASAGIKKGINAHVFMLLEAPTSAEQLKQWLKMKNLTVPLLRDQLALTKSGMALHWPLDITVCQNDKLLYIAPPTLAGFDEEPVKNRISLNKRGGRPTIPSVQGNIDEDARSYVGKLRDIAGLPKHKLEVKYYKTENAELMTNPDQAFVTGTKSARGFVYLNLNGGDSWGYFHDEMKPNVLHNFKGEPDYRLREIAPSYYKDAVAKAQRMKRDAHIPADTAASTQRFIINKRDEGKHYKVTYKPSKGVEIDPAPSAKHVVDWCNLHGIPIPDAVADWDVIFDPTSDKTIDAASHTINTYKPTKYKILANKLGEVASEDRTEIPSMYQRLFHHVCGSDKETTKHFINWLAYIWQTGHKPKTAWVLHGTYGTGKGRMLRLLQLLFGNQCTVTSPEAVSEHFNSQMERSQILWIDEVTTDSWDNAKITPKLRSWITEDTLPLRAMHKTWAESHNFMGIIVAANEHNPVEIRAGDRRWNVAPRQEVPLAHLDWATPQMLDDDYGEIYQEENLYTLATALNDVQVDVFAVRTPLENTAKLSVVQVTQSLPEDIVQALFGGDVAFFLQHVPTAGVIIPTVESSEYRKVVAKMMEGGKMPLRVSEISNIFRYLAGWNQTPGKFIKAAARYGLNLARKRARIDEQTFAGTYFEFFVTDEDRAAWAQLSDTSLKLVSSKQQKIG